MLFLCLSRACLGKPGSVVSTKWHRKKYALMNTRLRFQTLSHGLESLFVDHLAATARATSRRHPRPTLQYYRLFFLKSPYVCPEPGLVKRSFECKPAQKHTLSVPSSRRRYQSSTTGTRCCGRRQRCGLCRMLSAGRCPTRPSWR